MAEKTTFERVCDVLRDTQGIEDAEMAPGTALAELGLDSLATVEAVMACEDEFGIEIEAEASPKTVGEFVALVDALLAEE